MNYAPFGQRLGGVLLDYILFVPIIGVTFWGYGQGPTIAITTTLVGCILWYVYVIGCHVRWGRTLGKHLVGTRVRDLQGSAIDLARALKRSAVDIGLSSLVIGSFAIVISSMPAADFGRGWGVAMEGYDRIEPAWAKAVTYVWYAWVVAQMVTVLSNPMRRGIHDQIAGTIVLSEGQPVIAPTAPAPVAPGSRFWSIVDISGAVIGILLSALFILGAFYSAAIDDLEAYTGTIGIAVYGVLLAAMFAMAQRAMRDNESGTGWRVAAAILIVLPIGLIILGLMMS